MELFLSKQEYVNVIDLSDRTMLKILSVCVVRDFAKSNILI